MRDQDTLNAAAARIEELSMISKQVVQNLRDGAPSAYAQVYWLRREMGRVVATLGVGTPLLMREIDDSMEKMK